MKYLTTLLGLVSMTYLNAQTLLPATFSTNGSVNTIERDENNLYIGGGFTQIGLATNHFTLIPVGDDRPDTDLLQPNNYVDISIPDGNGGWYLGGNFTEINGHSEPRITHILPDNTLDPNFNLNLNLIVRCMFLNGQDLYIGGQFTLANTTDVHRLIRVNKSTGTVDTTWIPGILNGEVESVFVSGNTVHAGGSFTQISGMGNQQYYAQFDRTTAEPIASYSATGGNVDEMISDDTNLYVSGSFYQLASNKPYFLSFEDESELPNFNFPHTNGPVKTIEPDGSGGYYIGGAFTQLGNTSQDRLTHIFTDGTVDPNFSVSLNSTVEDLVLDGDSDMYIGGSFTLVNGENQTYVARINRWTSELDTTWTPTPNTTVNAVEVLGNTVHLGGNFSSVNGSSRSMFYVVLDKVTGATVQSEAANSNVYDLEADDNHVYIGGSFNQFGYHQPHLQLFNNGSDIPIFDFPTASSTIYDALPDGNNGWYIAGQFGEVGEVNVLRVAHIFADNSIDTAFSCSPNNTVYSIHLDGDDLYLGGNFTTVNGVNRTRVARVNRYTGILDTTWSAAANNLVNAIKTTSENVLLGGSFSAINGNNSAQYFAVLDKNTAELIQSPSPDATVNSIEMNGNEAYIGGAFSAFGYASHFLAEFSSGDSIPAYFHPQPNNTVEDLISDGNGGYFASGLFTTIDGIGTSRIIHILSDGSKDDNFNPGILNNGITCMTLSGGDLYVGGNFTSIGGNPIYRLAKLNATTGAVDPNFTPNPNGTVRSIQIAGNTVYICGSFTQVDDQERHYLAAVNTAGVLQSWNPEANNTVYDLKTDGSTVYVGGDFTTLNGLPATRLAGIDASSGALTGFSPALDGSVYSLLLYGSDLYAGGSFTLVDGTPRNRFASLNVTTGNLNTLTINPNGTVRKLAFDTSINMGISGDFTMVNGENHNRFVEVDLTNGNILARNINFNQTPKAILYTGSKLILGGAFTLIQPQDIANLALYDADAHLTLPINISNVNGSVNKIRLSNGVLYFCGGFSSVNNTLRQRLAAAHISDGALTPLSISTNGFILSMDIFEDTLYIGGNFTEINATPRFRTAGIDLNTSTLADWSPTLDGTCETIATSGTKILLGGSFNWSHIHNTKYVAVNEIGSPEINQLTAGPVNTTVNSLYKDGSTLYVGGNFSIFDGLNRQGVAAFDLNTNSTTSLDISANGEVSCIGLYDNTLYLGGSFTEINGEARNYFAAYSLTNNELTDFNPSLSGALYAIHAEQGRVLLGGAFYRSNEKSSTRVVSFDLNTNKPNHFFSSIDGEVFAMAIDNDQLFLGGTMTQAGGEPCSRFASINKITGTRNSIDFQFDNNVLDMTKVENELYVVGAFTTVNDSAQPYSTCIDLQSETITGFSPKFNSYPVSVTNDGDNLAFCGNFTLTQTHYPKNFAAISLSNGEPIDDFNHFINALEIKEIHVANDKVYIGGNFTQVDGEPRTRIAAFSTTDGALTPFSLDITTGEISDIETDGDNLYFSGTFTEVNGSPRERFAAYDLNLNDLLPLEISLNQYGTINDFEIGDGIVYFGGSFTEAMGEPRNHIAAIDLADGSLTDFDPDANSDINKILIVDSLLYVGGAFTTIGNKSRQHIAAIHNNNGSANYWNPSLNGNVTDLDVDGNYVFASGNFNVSTGNSNIALTLLDKYTGENLYDFSPGTFTYGPFVGNTVKFVNENVYVGGAFLRIDGSFNHPYLASFLFPAPSDSVLPPPDISGTIIWNSNCGPRSATILMYEPGTATLKTTYNTTVGSDGTFSIAEIEIGTYDIIVKVDGYLAKGVEDIMIAIGSDNNLALGTLTSGDLNNDGFVSFIDFSILNSTYGSETGGVNYNPIADINCDGSINFIDFSLLNTGYGQTGVFAPLGQ